MDLAGYTVLRTRDLEARLASLQERLDNRTDERDRLRIRLSSALATMMYGGANLEALFGPLEYKGTDPACGAQLWSARSGFADLQIRPEGLLVVSDPDPESEIESITILLDDRNTLDAVAVAVVKEFLARIIFRRQSGCGEVKELSLTARPEAYSSVPVVVPIHQQ